MATNTTSSETNTVWDINTDIYDIASSVNDVKSRYIEDIDEDTLSLGIFGFISDIESKKIQTATIMSAQLGNELFPTRAKLTKNVLAHAVYNNITDINAVPATMTINIGIKLSDFENYMIEDPETGLQKFIFDAKCPIFIEDIEFHFEYDIILSRSETATTAAEQGYVYSAHYDMENKNRLSKITEPYLKQPFLIQLTSYGSTIDGDNQNYYIIFQANIRQYTIEETSDKMISDSVIENKTFTFEFSNQLADFDVYVTVEGITTRLIPILYGGEIIDDPETRYCWYFFVSENTIRITFDSASYIPGLNSDILVRAYTTLGANGNFEYKKYDTEEGGLYVDLESEKYNYDRIQGLAFLVTDSHYGENSKTKEELQKLIPKMAHTRAGITTEQDVLDYFNLISTDTNRLVMRKKVDNQIARIWYAFFLLKDENNNVLPSNTINFRLRANLDMDPDHQSPGVLISEDGRFVVPAGTILKLVEGTNVCEVYTGVVPDPYTPEYYEAGYFYTLLHNVMITKNPLYTAFYLTTTNKERLFTYSDINEKSVIQFVANKINFKRSMLEDPDLYKSSFKLALSIADDSEIYDEEMRILNAKVVFVLYKNSSIYRWAEAKLVGYDHDNFVSSWELNLETDNGFDTNNDIKILNVHQKNDSPSSPEVYGYFPADTECQIFILARYADGNVYGKRFGFDEIVQGYENWTVTNVYNIDGGFNFYDNYTSIMNAKTTEQTISGTNVLYTIEGIPVAGTHYMSDQNMADYFISKINEKKDYITGCLSRLENNMEIDFKFFNTYGPSLTYTTDIAGTQSIGHIDMTMNFKLKLKSVTDIYTKNDIISFVKAYIENLEVIGDLHIPNLITDITNEFSSRIVYIEFVSFNGFPLGIQHALVQEGDIDTIPEFINVRNIVNTSTGAFVPAINIEVVNEKTSI